MVPYIEHREDGPEGRILMKQGLMVTRVCTKIISKVDNLQSDAKIFFVSEISPMKQTRSSFFFTLYGIHLKKGWIIA